eukprot:symbB.v1.2.022278.t1/scaffold1972.1/size94142/1
MAPLNIGYWVILFSLVSAQLTASGGEACDMQSFNCHTEEESEVALMQTKARGSKLLLQQAVERLSGLSGKPQKSKQHLEKITEDVKTLASQALIAKRQSPNITEGGITDPLTVTALNTMNDAAQEIVDQALKEAENLQNLLNAMSANLQACQDLLQDSSILESKEAEHDSCRESETDSYIMAQLAYEAAINSTSPPPCMGNWIQCTNPASTFFSIANSNELTDCLSSIRTWTQDLNESVQSVNDSSFQLFVDNMTECNRIQKEYETEFCDHRRDSVIGCQEALRCYEREKATYDEQAEIVGSSSGAQKSAYAAGNTILCLIDKLLTDLSETAVASCDAAQVNTSSLDIEIQSQPSFPPWDCGLSLNVHPCTDSWTQIYFDKAWYKDSRQTTGCDETYTEVYPGFPVAKGPDVWFKETNLQPNETGALQSWVDLGENAYQCDVILPATLHPSANQDSNSCLNTVQFSCAGRMAGGCFRFDQDVSKSGVNAFRNVSYRPNLGENGLEVWVVAKADSISGIQFMFDVGEFPSNGLGFYFSTTDTDRVLAYAQQEYADGVIPATASGLNVWRAQWKNSDPSESRAGYITVSLNNFVLANTTINTKDIHLRYDASPGRDDVTSKFFTLGGQSKSDGRYWNGPIAEVMFFDYILSHDAAATVKYGLWEKWGIQGGSGSCSTTSASTTAAASTPTSTTTSTSELQAKRPKASRSSFFFWGGDCFVYTAQ